eukprot:gene11567-biopygen15738
MFTFGDAFFPAFSKLVDQQIEDMPECFDILLYIDKRNRHKLFALDALFMSEDVPTIYRILERLFIIRPGFEHIYIDCLPTDTLANPKFAQLVLHVTPCACNHSNISRRIQAGVDPTRLAIHTFSPHLPNFRHFRRGSYPEVATQLAGSNTIATLDIRVAVPVAVHAICEAAIGARLAKFQFRQVDKHIRCKHNLSIFCSMRKYEQFFDGAILLVYFHFRVVLLKRAW